jgi:hypothetical protein
MSSPEALVAIQQLKSSMRAEPYFHQLITKKWASLQLGVPTFFYRDIKKGHLAEENLLRKSAIRNHKIQL